jgi:glycosyltransferase involved in cell wall biosynthesis
VKSVVVHRGARDHYQVARALDEHQLLDALITDLYWPSDAWWGRAIERCLPVVVKDKLSKRWAPALDHGKVQGWSTGAALSQLATTLPGVPFAWQRALVRWTDHRLGRSAQRRASDRDAAILSYSYYAYAAFKEAPARLPRILFQLHPHPASVRRILEKELRAHPECRDSLMREWELALPDEDYRRLVEETRSAHAWLVASTFTKQTMVEQGIPEAGIAVVPYGVDLDWFSPGEAAPSTDGPLRLLFVGTISQRKGIRYLVEAVERLRSPQVQLTVCGRVVDDLSVVQSSTASIDIRPNVSAAELRQLYRAADVFVLPSLAEGFGHVLLEALACGAPTIATTHSAGPDLIRDGREGFVIAPADTTALTASLDWCLNHRVQLAAMRQEARRRAEVFTWSAFRSQVAGLVSSFTAARAAN